jgi:hypothetical protein
VTGLAISPLFREDRTLFASTTAGVFRSTDGGERFSDWSDGLVPNRMVAIAASPSSPDPVVYALGLGGTIWRRRASAP